MATPGYLDSMDIGNRACLHVGAPAILSVDEDTDQNYYCSFAYDKLRRAELRRNVWRFATRRAMLRPIDTTTRMLVPDTYDSTITYSVGALVRDANSVIWQSTIPDNLNNAPHTTTAWEQYFGPLTVSLYDADITYYSGELVYTAGANAGSYVIFMSLLDGNDSDPVTADAWSATTTYKTDQVVSHSGSIWRSLIEFNLNITPADGPNSWDEFAIYSTGNSVTGSDGFQYTSVGDNNTGNDPTTDDGSNWTATNVATAWSREPENYESATSWLPIYGAATSIHIRYPIGAGPASQSSSRNAYRLPAGYLRIAPQAPKAGSRTILGGPTGVAYNDWEFEDDYLLTGDLGPIPFRFVADLTNVAKFDDMFCEGLACRIAIAVCQKLTQSTTKKSDIASEYLKFMSEARTVNAIETGPEEPPEDEFITCRI